jgi:hypothetical protein
MNDMKELETQVRMWEPRAPSPKLKELLFRSPAVPGTEHETRNAQHQSPAFRLSWLAPASVALIAMCLVFTQRNSPGVAGSTNSGQMVAMILSNQSAAAYLPGSFDSRLAGQNRLPADTFEWTNRSGSTSSIGSLAPRRGIK